MSTVLVIGSGGREHALAWKLALSPKVSGIITAPGNDAWPKRWERWEMTDFASLVRRARAGRVALVVVGPDNALADGIVDAFEAEKIPIFGPTAAAAQIEASKAFAKEVMLGADVPTPCAQVIGSSKEAQDFFENQDKAFEKGWVVKADGLAFGKGVRICDSRNEARTCVEEFLKTHSRVLVEEKVSGEEISWLAFCDGERCALLEPARDYKRVGDGNQGPNTGGMGAFSPVPGIPAGFGERLRREVFNPVLAAMKERGTPFRGILYAGLMTDFAKDRYWVLEFNARFGDPETQVLLPRMDSDLFDWCLACARGDLSALPPVVPFKKDAAVVVIAAAPGYPDAPQTGGKLNGVLDEEGFFVAGLARDAQGGFVTSGGRVFGALGVGRTLSTARLQAYERLKRVHFPQMHFRSDIAGDGELA